MELAKPALDVGLYTNEIDAMLAFWQEQVHVPYSELLKVGGGLHQHRHAIGDSVLKVNHRREPVSQDGPTGLSALEIYSDAVDSRIELLDPDGNEVWMTPQAEAPDQNLTLHMTVNDLTASIRFYGDVLGLDSAGADTFAVGASRIKLQQGEIKPFERVALGYRYMTLQVFDVVTTHAEILAKGGREGSAPVRLGEVAYISFVQDPDGNWIEISQRKSITGSLD
jgi:catechol 2,3-dioxygenase-like lactoylglutathione lyase family enzyme